MNDHLFLFLITVLIFTGCHNSKVQSQAAGESPTHSGETNNTLASEFELRVFQNENRSWGYDILNSGRQYIHQPEMPAVGGRKGFEQEWQARQVGKLALDKIKRGIMPPSISAAEVNEILQNGNQSN